MGYIIENSRRTEFWLATRAEAKGCASPGNASETATAPAASFTNVRRVVFTWTPERAVWSERPAMVLPPPGFTGSKVGTDVVRIGLDPETGLVGNEDAAVLHKRAVVSDEARPGLDGIPFDVSPGKLPRLWVEGTDAQFVALEITDGSSTVGRGNGAERSRRVVRARSEE